MSDNSLEHKVDFLEFYMDRARTAFGPAEEDIHIYICEEYEKEGKTIPPDYDPFSDED